MSSYLVVSHFDVRAALVAARTSNGDTTLRLVHGYFEIDPEKAWDTVRNDLPSPIAKLEPLAPPEEAS